MVWVFQSSLSDNPLHPRRAPQGKDAARKALRQRLGLSNIDVPIVGCVTRLVAQKVGLVAGRPVGGPGLHGISLAPRSCHPMLLGGSCSLHTLAHCSTHPT